MDTQGEAGALYRAMLQQASDAIFVLNASATEIVEVNSAAVRMSGYSLPELGALAPARLLITGVSGRPGISVAELIAVGAPEFEGYIRNRDGSSVPVSVGVSAIDHAGSRYILLIARDISERRRQAEHVAQAEKLAGMSRLTASIAHEINNPLQALHNSLYLLLNRQFAEERRQQLLKMAQAEVDQLIVLVQRMLEFHRPSREGMRPVSVHALLESALAVVGEQIQRQGVSVERDWADRLPWISGIAGHLKQVFMNLVTNAVEAMPDGGRLTIRTRVRVQGEGGHSGLTLVVIEFADSGPGIPESEAQIVFEPFYTSKKTRTGLGLALSYSIVEQHNGILSVSSDGSGTTFRVILPAASADNRQ
jgi:two-component system, NtrC family, sensor kinase